MNTKQLRVRMDPNTGRIWLVRERTAQPIERIKDITDDVVLAIAADIAIEGGTKESSREIKFSDGGHIRLLVQDMNQIEESNDGKNTTQTA